MITTRRTAEGSTNGPRPARAGGRSLPIGSWAGDRARHRGVAAVVIVLTAVAAALASRSPMTPLWALTAAGLLLLVLLLAQPDLAGLIVIALVYSNAVVIAVRLHGLPASAQYLVPLLLLLPLARIMFLQRGAVRIPPATIWAFAFLAVQAAGAVFARDPERSMASLESTALEGVFLFLLVTNVLRGGALVRQATIVVVLTAGALGWLSVAHDLDNPRSGDYAGFATVSRAVVNKDSDGGKVRHSGPVGEQNRWAQCLAVVLPLGLALGARDRSTTVRAAAWWSSVGITAGIVMTYSRGAAVGLALTGAIALALRWVRAGPAAIAAAAIVLGITTFSPAFAERTTGVTSAGEVVVRKDGTVGVNDGSYGNRMTEARAAFAVFSDNPVVGVGPGMFRTYFQEQARTGGADRLVGVDRQAHNLVLGIAAEHGIAGLVAFTGICASLLIPLGIRRRQHRWRPDQAALCTGYLAAVCTYLTVGLFLHFAYVRYFWLLAALAASMAMVRPESPPPDPSDPQPTARSRRRRADQTEPHPLPLAS